MDECDYIQEDFLKTQTQKVCFDVNVRRFSDFNIAKGVNNSTYISAYTVGHIQILYSDDICRSDFLLFTYIARF